MKFPNVFNLWALVKPYFGLNYEAPVVAEASDSETHLPWAHVTIGDDGVVTIENALLPREAPPPQRRPRRPRRKKAE